jgi:hypothetical protein
MDNILTNPCTSSTIVLIKICKNVNVLELDVDKPSIEAAMKYVIDANDESDAVYGILRFALHRSISMTGFDLEVIK